MKATRWTWMAVVLALADAATGCGGRDGEARAAVVDQEEVIPTGKDSALVVEEDWAVAVPEEEGWLERAREQYRRRQMQDAAAELRKAAAHIERLRERVDGPPYLQAERTSQELTRLAGEMEAGRPVPEAEMNRAMAHAHLALAAEHRALAEEKRQERLAEMREALANERERGAFNALGEEMTAAAAHLERAAALGGHGDDAEVKRLATEARALKERMDRGDELAAADVQRMMDQLGTASERLVQQVDGW